MKTETLPYMRHGHCCGCHVIEDQVLYRVGDLYRYRCRECYFKEVGRLP